MALLKNQSPYWKTRTDFLIKKKKTRGQRNKLNDSKETIRQIQKVGYSIRQLAQSLQRISSMKKKRLDCSGLKTKGEREGHNNKKQYVELDWTLVSLFNAIKDI